MNIKYTLKIGLQNNWDEKYLTHMRIFSLVNPE